MVERTCQGCGTELPTQHGGPPRKWCSTACQRPTHYITRACRQCGESFESRRGQRLCSPQCRRVRSQAQLRTSGRLRGTGYRKRARHFSVAYQSLSRHQIFERDAWVCGICKGPVDRDLAYPHPMSASLDHVIPMSVGGGHLPSNVQCAHLICNVEKGANISSVR